jgi:acetyltransferase
MSEDKTQAQLRAGAKKVEALLNPKNVVIIGATDKPGNWPQRVWRNLSRYGYKGPVFPFNPTRETVWDTRCYRTFAELPEKPDHLVVLAPAKVVPGLLRDAAAAGARSATVMTSGFEESTEADGRALADDLRNTIETTGLAVSGPNCLGNFNAAINFFSMPDDRAQKLAHGPVVVLGQSGGIVMAIKRSLEERGVDTQSAITSGNETGLTTADYIAYFAGVADVRVISCYLESVHDGAPFLEALRMARKAGKHVVIMKLGSSDAGRAAAAAHTGALAGSMEAFDAVAGRAGAIRVGNLDEMVEAVEFLVHAPAPQGKRLGSITFSGGMRGLLLDAAEACGMSYQPLSDVTRKKLEEILSVGSIIGNPLDAGFAALSKEGAYLRCVEILLDDPDIDILLLQEELPRAAGTERKERNLREVNALAAKAKKPIAYVSMISYGLSDYSRTLRAEFTNLPFLQEVDRALRTMRAITRSLDAHAGQEPKAPAANAKGRALLAELSASAKAATLNEVASKALLSTYGVPISKEELATSEDAAAAAAARIGYPVVAKIVSAALPHKSDIGGVKVGLKDEAAVRAAYRTIMANVAALPSKPAVDGVLIAQMVSGQLECALGAKLDPEMGPVVIFGSGGVDLELTRDVALAACPLDEAGALQLIARTRAGTIAEGYRGRPALDRKAMAQALVALSHLMVDAQGAIAEVDVNPFLVSEKGGVALDGLVVLNR